MSTSPAEHRLAPKSSPITPNTTSSIIARRATIVGPLSVPSTSLARAGLTPAKRILKKNMSGSSNDPPALDQTRKRSGSSGRVHFPDNQLTPEHAGEIVVQLSPDNMHADAHLGFLQEGRRYVINLYVPRYLGDNATVARANIHLQLKEIRTNADKTGHDFVLELEAYHDKLVSEDLAVSTPTGEFVLSLSARVLGKGKGTPMLKRGVRCIAVEYGDSEMSDASTAQPGPAHATRRASGTCIASTLKPSH